jgi:hypothetical protein
VISLIKVNYFKMNSEEVKLNGPSECRFGSIIFLLRMTGIPFKMKKVSTIYAIYMITVIVCCYSTLIGMSVDVYLHREDLGQAMTSMRAFIPFTNVMWVFSNCR